VRLEVKDQSLLTSRDSGSQNSAMPVPSKFVLPLFFLTIFAGAIILGPILYFGLSFVYPVPFHRAMNRALLISAVGAIGLFWTRIPFGKLWPLTRDVWLKLLLGYFIAAVSIQAMLAANVALSGFTSAHLGEGKVAGRVLLALIAALIAPFLEETIFRGFIQRELVASIGTRAGLILGALIYTVAHFIKIPVVLDQQPVHLWSGANALGAAFLPLIHGDFLSGHGLNLFLIGLILGGIFLRSETLWVNAGLHSGWIFGLLLFTGLTHPVEPPYVAFFRGDILSSFATTLVLVLVGLWLWRFYRHPSVLPENGENVL
jgi:membrane protease YdiL (CAAX protease family)